MKCAVVALAFAATLVSMGACDDDDGASGPSGLAQCVYGENTSCGNCDKGYAQSCITPDGIDCNTCPPDALCLEGLISGKASWGSSATTYFNAKNTICTIPCASDADCSALDWGRANAEEDYKIGSQKWRCAPQGGGSYCAVEVDTAGSGQSACQRCLSSCRGLSGCCSGSGCICASDC